MLVSHPYQFIYLKTSKTAGTSIEMALQGAAFNQDPDQVKAATHAQVGVRGVIGRRMIFNLSSKETAADKIWLPHISAADLFDRVGERIWNRYDKVASVRNPFDRMVSGFHWYRTVRHEIKGHKVSTREIAESGFDEIRSEFRDFIMSNDAIVDGETVMLNGKFCITKAIRYEHLREDLIRVAKELELDENRLRIPETLVSKHLRHGHSVADYYDQSTVEQVKKRMFWAFEKFGYPEKPGDQ